MWLLILEAGVAMSLLVFIVWWTMYSGNERRDDEADAPEHGDGPAS